MSSIVGMWAVCILLLHWKPTAGCQFGRPVRHVQTAIAVAIHVLEEHAEATGIVPPLPRRGQRDAKSPAMLGLIEGFLTNKTRLRIVYRCLLTIVGGLCLGVWMIPMMLWGSAFLPCIFVCPGRRYKSTLGSWSWWTCRKTKDLPAFLMTLLHFHSINASPTKNVLFIWRWLFDFPRLKTVDKQEAQRRRMNSKNFNFQREMHLPAPHLLAIMGSVCAGKWLNNYLFAPYLGVHPRK